MTEKQELERKILLKQQAIPQLPEEYAEECREQIRAMRRRLWELEDAEWLKLRRRAA